MNKNILIPEIKLETWESVFEYIKRYTVYNPDKDNNIPDYVDIIIDPVELNGCYFRGVDDYNYNLSSTLERYIKNYYSDDYIVSEKFFNEVIAELIENAKRKLKGVFPEQSLLLLKEYEN